MLRLFHRLPPPCAPPPPPPIRLPWTDWPLIPKPPNYHPLSQNGPPTKPDRATHFPFFRRMPPFRILDASHQMEDLKGSYQSSLQLPQHPYPESYAKRPPLEVGPPFL